MFCIIKVRILVSNLMETLPFGQRRPLCHFGVIVCPQRILTLQHFSIPWLPHGDMGMQINDEINRSFVVTFFRDCVFDSRMRN